MADRCAPSDDGATWNLFVAVNSCWEWLPNGRSHLFFSSTCSSSNPMPSKQGCACTRQHRETAICSGLSCQGSGLT